MKECQNNNFIINVLLKQLSHTTTNKPLKTGNPVKSTKTVHEDNYKYTKKRAKASTNWCSTGNRFSVLFKVRGINSRALNTLFLKKLICVYYKKLKHISKPIYTKTYLQHIIHFQTPCFPQKAMEFFEKTETKMVVLYHA